MKMIQILLLAVTLGVSTATQQRLMKVNKTGHVAKESLPTCNNSGTINILSYQYQYYAKDHQYNTSLSPAAKLVIHKMCSLQKTCADLQLPLADLKHVNATEINVKYSCLDRFTTFVDICSNTTIGTEHPVHMVLKRQNNSIIYKNCTCHIASKGGNFDVSVSDVRLKSATGRTCTRSQLYVNNQTFICNKTKDDYGSVFLQTVHTNAAEYLVKMNTGNLPMEPEMIYLAIKPKSKGAKVKLNVTCKNRLRTTAPVDPSACNRMKSKGASPMLTSLEPRTLTEESSTSSMTSTIAVACGCAVALILVSAAVFMGSRTRTWKYTKWITHLERLVERRIQHPRDESNIQSPAQCIDDDENVELKKKSSAPMFKNCREAGFDTPTDSSYDPVNNLKPVLGTADALDDIEDSTVYSYAKHQPEKRIIATQSSLSNPDDRTVSKVHGIAKGDNVINKHVYVKLLPVQETAAGDCCDSVQLNTECDKSDVHQSEASNLKKTGGFNASEVNETILSYSFAKELYQASITAQLNSRNPEEPMSYSGKNQYDSTTSANKMKVSPSRNYDRAKKREISETPYASDDDCYDKINSDRIPVQINPNYDKLSK